MAVVFNTNVWQKASTSATQTKIKTQLFYAEIPSDRERGGFEKFGLQWNRDGPDFCIQHDRCVEKDSHRKQNKKKWILGGSLSVCISPFRIFCWIFSTRLEKIHKAWFDIKKHRNDLLSFSGIFSRPIKPIFWGLWNARSFQNTRLNVTCDIKKPIVTWKTMMIFTTTKIVTQKTIDLMSIRSEKLTNKQTKWTKIMNLHRQGCPLIQKKMWHYAKQKHWSKWWKCGKFLMFIHSKCKCYI